MNRGSEMHCEAADAILGATRRWVESFVVAENLCPFAGRELRAGRVRFALCPARDESGLLQALEAELQLLLDEPATETTLLVHPFALQRFEDYNDFLDRAEALLRVMELEGVMQIASFHPCYRFEGTALHAAENYSNRSPYPMLHLLREASVSRAVDSHPDVGRIPARNIAHLTAIGTAALSRRLDAMRLPTPKPAPETADIGPCGNPSSTPPGA